MHFGSPTYNITWLKNWDTKAGKAKHSGESQAGKVSALQHDYVLDICYTTLCL